MTATPPSRPWYRRKRAWAALALWAAVAYPLSAGPAAYFVGRWPATFRPAFAAVFGPIDPRFTTRRRYRAAELYGRYLGRWTRLGNDHTGRPEVITNGVPWRRPGRTYRVDPFTGRVLGPDERSSTDPQSPG